MNSELPIIITVHEGLVTHCFDWYIAKIKQCADLDTRIAIL